MKKLFILILLLISPINIYASDYIVNKDNYKVRITTNKNITSNDEIIIIDDRNNYDIQVVNSYKITDSNMKQEIIDIILEYNKKYPNNKWKRSKNTMYYEWIVHNILYKLYFFRNHTISVDFDNNDEYKYILISKLFTI